MPRGQQSRLASREDVRVFSGCAALLLLGIALIAVGAALTPPSTSL